MNRAGIQGEWLLISPFNEAHKPPLTDRCLILAVCVRVCECVCVCLCVCVSVSKACSSVQGEPVFFIHARQRYRKVFMPFG